MSDTDDAPHQDEPTLTDPPTLSGTPPSSALSRHPQSYPYPGPAGAGGHPGAPPGSPAGGVQGGWIPAGSPGGPSGPGGPGGPSGPGYIPPPPYGNPPPWSQTSWSGAPPWYWQPAPPPARSPQRPGPAIFTTAVAVAVAVAAILGVLVGHAVWKAANNSVLSPSATSPLGNGGFGSPGTSGGSSGSGQGSTGSGGPANAASIAKGVDPGLVDVSVSISYRGLQGAGTGMVITPSGEVLTNNHVVNGATSISVTDIGNGKTYNATVVGYDRALDVAVLQLSGASGLQTVTLGDSSKVTTGQPVVAIGNANGVGGTPSYAGGSVTGLNQSISASDQADGTSEQLSGLIQTNADIVAGDSGGPLVNTAGQVVGIDTASAGSGGFQFQAPANEGFSVPINSAVTTARKIEAGSSSPTIHVGPTAFLGVLVEPPGTAGNGIGGVFGNGGNGGSGNGGSGSGSGGSTSSGAYIAEVVPGGPADQAGLQAGDTITSVDGHSVSSPDSLTSVMLSEKPNSSVQVVYIDNSGNRQTANVRLASGPAQ
jgi:S1-C subfamily serine protease